MKRFSAAALVVLLVGVAGAQWLEQTIIIPNNTFFLTDAAQVFFNPVNNHAYIGGGDCGGMQVIDAAARTRLYSVDYVDWLSSVLVDTGRRRVYVIDDGNLVVLEASSDSFLKVVPLPRYSACGALNPARHKAYVACRDTPVVYVLDVGPDTVLRRIDVADGAWRIVYDSARVFLLPNDSAAHGIAVIDCSADTVVGRMPTIGRRRDDMVLDAAGRRLYVIGSKPETQLSEVWVYDTDSLRLRDTIALPPSWSHIDQGQLRLNTRARILYVADILTESDATRTSDASDSLAIIDCATSTVLGCVGFPHALYSLTFNEQSGKLYAGAGDSLAVLGVPDSITAWVHLTDAVSGLGWAPPYGDVYAMQEENLNLVSGTGDTLMKTINCSTFDVYSMLWLPAERRLYTLGEAGFTVIDHDNTILKQVSHNGRPWSRSHPAYSAELNRLYTAAYNGVTTIDCGGDSLMASTPLPRGSRAQAFLVPGSHKLYIQSFSDTLEVYDIYSDSCRRTAAWLGTRFSHNPRNGLVYAYSPDSDGVRVVDPRSDSVVVTMQSRELDGMILNTVDNELYGWINSYWGENYYFYIYDAAASVFVDSFALPETPCALAWYEPGDKLYAVGDSSLFVIDCRTREVMRTVSIRHQHRVASTLLNPRNNKLWIAGRGGVDVVECRTDSVVASFDVASDKYLAWNPVDNRVYAANRQGVFVFRDDPIGVEAGHFPAIARLTLRPNSNPAAGAVSFDCAVPGACRASLSIHDATGRVVSTLDVSPAARTNVLWPGQDAGGRALPAGVYFARLESGPDRVTAKVILR